MIVVRSIGHWRTLAATLILLATPMASLLDSPDLKDDYSTGLSTTSNSPIMNNMSSLVEDGLAQFSGNVWVEPNDEGGYTVLNLDDPVWFAEIHYLTPGITVVDHDESVLRRIELPSNITGLHLDAPSRKDTCTVDLMEDESVYLFCNPKSTAGSYSSYNQYLDFATERIYVDNTQEALFVWWNETGVFQDAWVLDNPPNGECWVAEWKMHEQVWKLTESGVVMSSYDSVDNSICSRDIGNTTLQCPIMPQYWSNGWQDTYHCDGIFTIGRNGSVENVVYSNANGNGLCGFGRMDVGPYGKIEIQTGHLESGFNYYSSQHCDFYDANGTDLDNRIAQYGWLILDTDLGFLWDHQRFPCHSTQYNMHTKYRISDIEWTPAGVYYIHLQTSTYRCQSSAWTSDHNLTDYGGTSSQNLTVGLMDLNGTVYWNRTWRATNLEQIDGGPYAANIRASAWGFTFIKPDGVSSHGQVFWDEGTHPWGGYFETDWSATFSHDGEILFAYEPASANGGFSSNNCYDVPPNWVGHQIHPLSANLNGIFIRCSSSNSQQSYSLATQIIILTPDTDRDGYGHYSDDFPLNPTQHSDVDGDGYGDNPMGQDPDACPTEPGTSTEDRLGCPDTDGDNWSDLFDAFPFESSQWEDTDSDGYGDNTDGNQGDDCPEQYGESNRDLLGCPDADYDGWSDDGDVFPSDSSQWADSDGDGYGDQFNGFQGDSCPGDSGTSYIDRFGCPDTDADGWSNIGDAFPLDPTQWADRDGDGYGDNTNGNDADVFPNNPTQWADSDGDGYGDDPFGLQGDAFPLDPTQTADRDGDGYGDNPAGTDADAFSSNPMQWADTDGDGYGDDPFGLQGDGCPTEWGSSTQDVYGCPDTDGDGVSDRNDAFPLDPDYWLDSDRDGTPDVNDDFPFDSTQWSDADGDGWGDNPTGPLADAFPNDPTQWADSDGDGLGENPDGNNPDPYLNDFDNDGYNDSVDILPQLASPGDLDNDGVPDEQDEFVDDPQEWNDNDGDGDGDNIDSDDDNDGWSDVDEDRHGTDPLDSSSVPVEAFQIILPGTTIGLDSWDLIGIFGGGPILLWLMFGFVTRNRRTRGIEIKMEAAQSRQELEEIAQSSEFLLMLRLLGTHQGIKLERVRAELDDVLEAMEGSPVESFDHTGVVARDIAAEERGPEVPPAPPTAAESSKPDPMESYIPPAPKLSKRVSDDLMGIEDDPEIDDLVDLADGLE